MGDRVFFKLSPWKGIIQFGRKGKLSPRYIEPYEILEQVGPIAYRLALLMDMSKIHNVFYVSVLRKCILDPTHVLETQPIQLKKDLSCKSKDQMIIKYLQLLHRANN